MNFSATLALAVIVIVVTSSSALPAQKRMFYYQRPAQYYAAPQRMMYVQYMHPAPYARSTQGAEALVAGESVATGTYLEDCEHSEADISAAGPAVTYEAPTALDIAAERGEDVLSEPSFHATQAKVEAEAESQSVAEAESEAVAYPLATESLPAFELPADVDIVDEENEVPDDDAKMPGDFDMDAATNNNAGDEKVASVAAPEAPIEAEAPNAGVSVDLPVLTAPIAPVVKPINRYLPAKKKVYVALEQSVEDTGLEASSQENIENEEDDEVEEEYVAPVATVTRSSTRRPAVKKPAKAASAAPSKKEQRPLPVGTFFPIDFGGTKGGAIAIANSFSTGEGGSATSHAIAYGSPDAASLRGCVSCKKL